MSNVAKSKTAHHKRRAAAIVAIAFFAWVIAIAAGAILPASVSRAEDFFYDSYYRARPVTDMQDADVVLIAADDASMDKVDEQMHFGWPWPRELWGQIAKYAADSGARAVVFDILFKQTSAYQDRTGDDDNFAAAIKGLASPVVFGDEVQPAGGQKGAWGHFAPPVAAPRFGAVNLGTDRIYRTYQPRLEGKPSLALAAIEAAGIKPRLSETTPFLLHYYGPYKTGAGRRTFCYVSAATVLSAQITGDAAAARAAGVTPALFKGKIVVLGATTVGTYDLKSSPLSEEYPGPEIQATAIENLLHGDRVVRAGAWWLWLLPLFCGLLVSAGVVVPRRAILKMAAPVVVAGLLLGIGVWLFRGNDIVWLPPVGGLIAIVAASLAAFAWTYFAEDRQRRFMLKALSKVVSPAVAEQLAADPGRLALGTQRAELTMLFTDLANFTSLAEGMNVEALGQMLNRYLEDMSGEVLAQDGTLDKYIGDAVMCFWNAPLSQADHATRACRAALGMARRERKLREEFPALGAKLFTRIGINTASVAVGFVGSSHLFNYTVLGDGVNLASRVEGANKAYGTQILITENTARLVADKFCLRRVDVVRVKGKSEPMALYELLGEKGAEGGDKLEQLAGLYADAFGHYQQQRWADCEKVLLEVFRLFGEDGPAKSLAGRASEYRASPPAATWDGVHDAKEK